VLAVFAVFAGNYQQEIISPPRKSWSLPGTKLTRTAALPAVLPFSGVSCRLDDHADPTAVHSQNITLM